MHIDQHVMLPVSPGEYIERMKESYAMYVDTLALLSGSSYLDKYYCCYYEKIWKEFFTLKPDFVSMDSLSKMVAQLLTGCRFAGLARTVVRRDSMGTRVSKGALKGGAGTSNNYPALPPTFRHLLDGGIGDRSMHAYWRFRRELRNASPSFFKTDRGSLLGLTHLFRQFFIQVMHLVLKVSLLQLTHMLGWRSEESIRAYINPELWLSSKEAQSGS